MPNIVQDIANLLAWLW
uniref:Uncharacterized protein n=1 Tax=Anguilla anguilla TaxID=7936 RepID=A0A0E9V239_ANGAN